MFEPRAALPHLALCLLLALGGGCAVQPPPTTPPDEPPAAEPAAASERGFTVLAINDVYRLDGLDDGTVGGLPRVRTLRRQLETEDEVLMLHAGDLLAPSLLSRQFYGAQMIDVLNRLDGDADAFDGRFFVTLGNHEFDADSAEILERRIRESDFRWFDTNLTFAKDNGGEPEVAAGNLTGHALVDLAGVRVGLFGITLAMEGIDFITDYADPVATARETTAALRRQGAEMVIALTHQAVEDDVAMIEALGPGGPDLVIGGHEHQKLERMVTGADGVTRAVYKADADARTASVIEVTLTGDGPPRFDQRFVDLGDDDPAPDPALERRVAEWNDWFDESFCRVKLREPLGCLETVLGRTRTRLVAEELEIRRYETNLGSWVADLALAAFAAEGAQVAVANSGSLRLNENVPPGNVTRRVIEGLFAYPAGLKLVRIDGATLQTMVDHSIEQWNAAGHFLQVAGFAFRHDTEKKTAKDLTLLAPDGPRPVDPAEQLLLVAPAYLLDEDGDQDGYKMLRAEMIVPTDEPVDLKQEVLDALGSHRDDGIAPEVVGRICTTGREGPCLAVDTGGDR